MMVQRFCEVPGCRSMATAYCHICRHFLCDYHQTLAGRVAGIWKTWFG
jgi:hypothetical protein